ncbi:MAG: PQQ-binding-like beta-propeller repeat protein [Planctomycetales bacterium]
MRATWIDCITSLCLIASSCTFLAAGEPNWPQFRGPAGAGTAGTTPLPEKWSKSEHVTWKQAIPGKGWSSPIVSGDRVFLTTVTSEAPGREPRKGLYIEDLAGTKPEGVHHWLVYCLELSSGKILWQKEAHSGKPLSTVHLKNSYASETPVTDGKYVYANFGNVGLYCYDNDGNLKWSRDWEQVPTRFGWGPAASPTLHKDRLYLVNDNEKDSYLLCLDAATGKDIWKTPRKERSTWSTPFVWENPQRTEIVTAGTGKIRSYDLEGKLLWELGPNSTNCIPTPIAAHGLLYVASGYVADKVRPIYAIRPGGKGDISLKPMETSNESIAWSVPQGGPYHPTPVIVGETLYVLYDRGLLASFNALTGAEIMPKTRLGAATAFTASPWTANGKVFCLNEDGETFVVAPDKKLNIVATNPLEEMALATPAIAGDRLLIRTKNTLYCVK